MTRRRRRRRRRRFSFPYSVLRLAGCVDAASDEDGPAPGGFSARETSTLSQKRVVGVGADDVRLGIVPDPVQSLQRRSATDIDGAFFRLFLPVGGRAEDPSTFVDDDAFRMLVCQWTRLPQQGGVD